MDMPAADITTSQAESQQGAFPIVGIGASAGGLEAFIQVLKHLPPTTGMAYIYVQHLDPIHDSLLPDLLSHVTTMPVSSVQEMLIVEPNHVYVIAPNTNLTITHGLLIPSARTLTDGQHLSINTFLCSLAEQYHRYAFGVLLSGTASDGTLGLQAIKRAGGMTLAQDAVSATYPAMPQSAITAGYVDMVLPPDAIARELVRCGLHLLTSSFTPADSHQKSVEEEQAFIAILELLHQATGVNFLSYKRPTIMRRLLHRMAMQKIHHVADYLLVLQDTPAEVERLYQDVLITVTSFFRDPLTFDTLTDLVFPSLMQQRAPGDPIRVWVIGASTGEEVYSLAICLREFLEETSPATPMLLFATDVKAEVLKKARAGIYSSRALRTVSSERLHRFFTPVEGGYKICSTLRDHCVFAQHDISRDTPFSRLDLVSCRNVLIYLGSQLQHQVMQTFHYALKPRGFLLLGTSETAGYDEDLFTALNHTQKLYTKKNTRTRFPFDRAIGRQGQETKARKKEMNRMDEEYTTREEDLQEADHVLLAHYVPASVVINEDMEILHFRGHTGPYLEPASGKASFNVLNMARDGLRPGLRSAIVAAIRTGYPVTKEGLQVSFAGNVKEVTVQVHPLADDHATQRLYLVVFTDTPLHSLDVEEEAFTGGSSSKERGGRGSKDRQIALLEQELVATRKDMQAMIEERNAADEEIRSSNEELQSINEELETSQEEIRATNEELTRVNQELTSRNEQLKAAYDYANAIVATIREPLLVLDTDMRVVRANRSFYQFFQVSPEDTEQRSLYKLGNGQWNLPRLRTLLEEVLPVNQHVSDFVVEDTFPGIGHRIMLLNARRIVQEGNRELLILLAIEDISERKDLERRKDEFIAMASRELKTPITSLRGYTELLYKQVKKEGNDRAAKVLDTMDAQINRLTGLVNDLLDVSIVEAGKLALHRGLFDLDDLMRETVEILQHTTKKHHIRIEGVLQELVYGDAERIGQVLINMLSNAIKYSPQADSILIKITRDTDSVTVGVQDFGIGIAKDQHEKVFERFFRVSGLKQEMFPGIGLGLYISMQFIKQHGGRMWVESREGSGSTFFFTLPLRQQLDSAETA